MERKFPEGSGDLEAAPSGIINHDGGRLHQAAPSSAPRAGRRLRRLDAGAEGDTELVMAWLAGAVVGSGEPPVVRSPREQLVRVLQGAIDDLLADGDEDGATTALEALMALTPDEAETAADGGR
jgi:hypothetical protein